jgi:predicted transcriptional regulator
MLGPLENVILETLWRRGESNVREVTENLERPLAYTTVMTTLDRLYKKGILQRRKEQRAFFYAVRYSRAEWEQKRAGDLVVDFLSSPEPQRDLLISYLVDAVGNYDESLLDELERRIRFRRGKK